MLTLDKIYHAKFVLKQVARKTDLIAATRLCPGTDLYLKTENLQVTGSFKVRGAYYKISQLSAEERAKGVIACSAGNHAQGVALAATRMGIKSVVCMPDGAPIMKVESTKRLGAEVELVKGTYDDAHDRAVELQEQTGMTFIHPYDDELVIAGQGTIGLEILDQLPDVDAVIVPIGGGGLISGVAFAIKSLRPEVKIYGVQAAGAPSMEHAFHDHKYETLDSAVTFADGIAVKTPGETTFDMVSQYVDEIVTVSEDEIAAAILALMENQKLVAEGAGATPVAAALFGKLPLAGKKTVCLISGGNIDVNILSRVITRGLVMSGRKTNLMIALEDKPGQLSLVSDIVSACGANVVSVHHDRSDANMAITSCFLKLGLETRDAAQIETIKQKLTEAGFKLVTERVIDDVFSLFRKGSYAALFKQMLSSLPGATLTINTVQTQTSAYVRSAQSDIETVERTVKSLLNNHFFNVVASPSEADIIVTLDNKCRKGNTVPGELYNFIEFFSTLGIKIENNRTGQTMLNYSINDERTLVPENKSASQGKNMAARELIKRLNREFARELKKITFDRTGKIPERQKMLPDVPVPVVGSSVPEKEADPVISVPVVLPEVIPAPLVPVKSAKPENQKAIRVEWLDGVFVEFDKLATLGDKSRIHLKIVNTNADDCEVDLYSGNLTVINEKGEESPIVSLKLGSKFNDRRVTALIVPDLPTEMVIEVSKLQSVALLQLKDFKNNIVKLRGLK